MGRPGRLLGGIASGAFLIAGITILSRIAGFGRIVVFSRTVGATCVGEVYQTANGVPNIVFEVVAGGALAGAVVPLLAGRFAQNAREEAGQVASALLTWSLAVLTPITILAALVVRPIVMGLLGPADGCPSQASAVDLAARMLLIFLPQIPLYGVAVVLSGERCTWCRPPLFSPVARIEASTATLVP